jgi:glyoxylase-like metal-dependent hydrolase (beta-lactamase superfamily II)
VRNVILTHGDIDHVSGLGAMPEGLAIYAHAATAKRIAAAAAAGRSRVPANRVPNHPVGGRMVIADGPLRIDMLHWAPAHTDGDLVVWLPGEKVVFTGDIFAMDQPRALIHAEQAGTSLGWIASARRIVALPARTFVVGHGTPETRASLTARTNLVARERADVARLAAQHVPLAEIQRQVNDGPVAAATNGPRFTPFSAVVYEEVTHR